VRPVRRERLSTSGTSSTIASTSRATRLLSARLVPGSVCTPIVSVPSLNGGRNSPPIQPIIATLAATNIATTASTARAWRRVNRSTASSIRLSQRSRNESSSSSRSRDLANSR